MCFAGNSKPIECKAARTRSRLSAMDLSANPTIVNAGNPFVSCTSVVIFNVSIPTKETVVVVASIWYPLLNYQRGILVELSQSVLGYPESVFFAFSGN